MCHMKNYACADEKYSNKKNIQKKIHILDLTLYF